MLSDSLGGSSKKISWSQSLLRNNNARNYDLLMTTNAGLLYSCVKSLMTQLGTAALDLAVPGRAIKSPREIRRQSQPALALRCRRQISPSC
jgi:hypothetical protein